MKIWSSIQKAVESRVNNSIRQLTRDNELADLEHRAACGSILLESRQELLAYEQYKKDKTIPEVQPAELLVNPADKT